MLKNFWNFVKYTTYAMGVLFVLLMIIGSFARPSAPRDAVQASEPNKVGAAPTPTPSPTPARLAEKAFYESQCPAAISDIKNQMEDAGYDVKSSIFPAEPNGYSYFPKVNRYVFKGSDIRVRSIRGGYERVKWICIIENGKLIAAETVK
jgi:hypothetical protein